MRVNKFIAQAPGISRRKADGIIERGKVAINGQVATAGSQVTDGDQVTMSGKPLTLQSTQTIVINKPVSYVCSRDGQGSKTIYDLLPAKYHHLKPVGRLDKDSSGVLVLTNDGELANQLTHPKFRKVKVYEVLLDKELSALHQQMISDRGIMLDDGVSKLILDKLDSAKKWRVTMHEGRNRQIRRTFESLGYTVTDLKRTHFGPYSLSEVLKLPVTPNTSAL